MPNLPRLLVEREHLVMADRHIAEGECRVTAQMLLLERIGEGRRDTRNARDLLRLLQQTLDTWVVHRHAILREIARLEQTEPPPRP
jgi:hypothetical protein